MINVEDEKYIEEVINKNQNVSILTACLNESGSIGKWLDQVSNVIQGTKCKSVKELVIVDDGSKDGTIDIIIDKSKNFPIPIKLIRRDVRMGTLNAQIIGSRACSSEYILILDCDLQHPVDFIIDFLEKLEDEPDIIIGSRYMPYVERLLDIEITDVEIKDILKKIGIDCDISPITKIVLENDRKLKKTFLRLK